MNIELTVSNKRIVITEDGIFIWNPECWDGEDENKIDELLNYYPITDFAFYDRTDGAPYYWKYPVEEVVDAIDTLISPLQVMQLRSLDKNVETMADGRRFTFELDTIGPNFLKEVNRNKIYWIKRDYLDVNTGEVIAYLVTEG
jgi:hypothetical protein